MSTYEPPREEDSRSAILICREYITYAARNASTAQEHGLLREERLQHLLPLPRRKTLLRRFISRYVVCQELRWSRWRHVPRCAQRILRYERQKIRIIQQIRTPRRWRRKVATLTLFTPRAWRAALRPPDMPARYTCRRLTATA